jgi:hypothetical protein
VYAATVAETDGKSDITKIRRMLGDEFIDHIMLRGDSVTDVIERPEVVAEFPEAQVGVLLHYITP